MRTMINHAVALVRHALRDRVTASKRSPKWPAVRREFLKMYPYCAACGGTDHLEAHHIQPFHLHPELELDSRNLIALCMGKDRHCHLLIAHGDNFKCWNTDVVNDAKVLRRAYAAGEKGVIDDVITRAKERRAGP